MRHFGPKNSNYCCFITDRILGARFGVDAIPEGWIRTVNNAKPRSELNMIDHNAERVAKNLLKLNKRIQNGLRFIPKY